MPLAAEPSYGPFSGSYSEVGNHVGHAVVVNFDYHICVLVSYTTLSTIAITCLLPYSSVE
jgi:hypothetical protein